MNRILRLVPDTTAASPPQNADVDASLLVTSSPLDGTVLRNANAVFKEALLKTAFATPIRKHAHQLSNVAEKLHAKLPSSNTKMQN